MNALVAALTGQPVSEGVPVPVASKHQDSARKRSRYAVQRRTAAALMGMAEDRDTDSLIPDNAVELDRYTSTYELGFNKDLERKDAEPDPPTAPATGTEDDAEEDTAQLISPKAALVAPDVTPHTLDPIDPSEVPAPAKTAAPANATASAPDFDPLKVILGRSTAQAKQAPEPETPVTAESAQATINSLLSTVPPADLLGKGREMPPHQPSNPGKIMEAFARFSPVSSKTF